MWAANLTTVAQTLYRNKQIHPVILEKHVLLESAPFIQKQQDECK